MAYRPTCDMSFLKQWNNDDSAHWRIYAPQGFILNIKTVFPGMGNFFRKIGRSWDRLIFIMGIPIPVRRNLYIEIGPRKLLRVKSIEKYLKKQLLSAMPAWKSITCTETEMVLFGHWRTESFMYGWIFISFVAHTWEQFHVLYESLYTPHLSVDNVLE